MLIKRAAKHLETPLSSPSIITISLPKTQVLSFSRPYKTKKKHFIQCQKVKQSYMLENTHSFLELPHQQQYVQIENRISPRSKGKMSPYLQYKSQKKQNKCLKAAPSVGLKGSKGTSIKSNLSTTLKSKLIQFNKQQQRNPIKNSRSIQQFCNSCMQSPSISPSKKRKMSMIVLSSASPPVQPIQRSVLFSIKTSEGKRRQIDSCSYIRQLKQKIRTPQLTHTKQHIQINPSVYPNDVDSSQPLFHVTAPNVTSSSHVNSRHRRIVLHRRRMKQDSNINNDQDQCRPWTSNKSEVHNQD